MGTITIRRTFQVDGVYVDPTSVKLSDPTGTYGVKRDDTGAVVVADGTAMEKVTTGIYQYSFTEPADGLSYTAYVEIVYGGATYHFEHDFEDQEPDGDGLYYCERQDIEDRFGTTNVQKWADLDNDQDGATIARRILAARRYAYEQINAQMRRSRYAIPLADDDGETPYDISEIAANLAGVWLYENRGVTDYDDDTGQGRHQLKWNRDRANMELRQIRSGARQIDAVLKTAVTSDHIPAIAETELT